MTQPAPTPINEAARLSRVIGLGIGEGVSDPVLEEVLDLVKMYFQAPITLISILEEQRQWFKASRGVSVTQTPREVSFCGYVILANDVLVIPDARLDERFRDNPLVTDSPHIRFYAGMPLITSDGLGLGTLCVIDTKPRPLLNQADTAALQRFASLVMHRICGLRSSTFFDQQTGLLNRVKLELDIVARWEQPMQSLVSVDMMSPQMLNDIVKALGHNRSQNIMLVMLNELLRLLPLSTAVYCLSETRFGFFMEGGPGSATSALFARIAQRFKQPVICDGIPILADIGIGAMELSYNQAGASDWLRMLVSASDEARIKDKGWIWYEPGLCSAQERAFTLLSSLADALQSNDQLRLAYQPRFDVQTGEILSAEALLRWDHPYLGAISPGEFIPLAERTSMIRSLSLWVIRQAVGQAVSWHRTGHSLRISINVSAEDMESTHFTDSLLSLLGESGLPPHFLEMEFTESALCQSPDSVREQLDRLRAVGIDIAIDDFGTGYSNWTYLRQLPATAVKVDRSLVCNITRDESDLRLVETLIDLGRHLGYRIVAEGVETGDTLEVLRRIGCHEVQGYYLARPMEVKDFEAWRLNYHSAVFPTRWKSL
jgi:EAL domain-containing protein (putative c-di-GMP-specific phosphodiesterase class I)/GGDEF domain-containing protein